MMKKEVVKLNDYSEFSYPSEVPNGVEECCPEKIETPKYPSPTSCQTPEELKELEECIREANELLLGLALATRNGEDRELIEDEVKLRHALEGLKGQFVILQLDKENEANKKKLSVSGFVCLVGRDFVLLKDTKENEIFILFKKICKIQYSKKLKDPIHVPKLIEIDPCLQQEIALNFGNTVANSPKLIQLFFGIDLKAFLCFEKRNILIKTEKAHYIGQFQDMNDEKIVICRGKRKRSILVENILFIKTREKKRRR